MTFRIETAMHMRGHTNERHIQSRGDLRTRFRQAERMHEYLRRATAIQSLNKREMGMSSKPKSNGGAEPQTTSAQAEAGEVSVGNSVRAEEIRRRAFEIYLERGKQPGLDVADWLQAEHELARGVLGRAQAG
jgi:DUF2934 family protein